MRLARIMDIAVGVVTYLALRGPGLVTMVELSMVQQVPPPLLLRVMRILVRSGLVEVKRGEGGFSLRRPAEEVNVREVIHALDYDVLEEGDTKEEDLALEPS